MNGQWILVIYVLILILLLYLLYRAVKHISYSLRWSVLFIIEIAAVIFSLISAVYYNERKGEGIMPGLTWIGESIFSIGAVAVFSILFIITLIIYIACRKR